MAHPFRFGIQLSNPLPGETWRSTARKVESLGYSSLMVPDHFGEQLGPVVALSMAAEATTDLRVGALVFDNDYRHPVTLAKEMATLDLLSSGRLELGLGAGWMRTDYEQSGMPYDEPKVRVDRFEESLRILEQYFTGGTVDFEGRHYTISGLPGLPVPHTPGGPPILIGGGGKRVLTLAARHADIVGINPNLKEGEVGPAALADAMPDATDRKVAWVREAAGDRLGDIEFNMLCFVAEVTEDRAGFGEVLGSMFGVDPEVVLEAPLVVAGSVEEITELLEARRERWGFSYYVFQGEALDKMAPVVERLTGR